MYNSSTHDFHRSATFQCPSPWGQMMKWQYMQTQGILALIELKNLFWKGKIDQTAKLFLKQKPEGKKVIPFFFFFFNLMIIYVGLMIFEIWLIDF